MSLYTKDTVFKVVSSENVSYTGTAANGASAPAYVGVVRLVSTTDCWVKIGKSATATTSDVFLPAFVAEYFQIGQGERVSAIRDVSSGTLNVAYMAH